MPCILFIGPTLSSDAHTIGGTTISFDLLVKQAGNYDCSHSIISVNRTRHSWLNALLVLFKALVMIPQHRIIMLNANPRGALLLAPAIAVYTRVCRKKYVFRMFGGDLIEIYESKSSLLRLIMRRSIFSADRIYLQTKRMVHYFDRFSTNTKWLPTARELGNIPLTTRRTFHGRFVYIGQIKQNKGIDLLIEIANTRPDIKLAIYGPILEPAYEILRKKDCYHGILSHNEVGDCLSRHDVLLLPTFHPGEGYPGVIIEAFAAGLPVVTTNWLAIPEIVKHQFNGILIQPHCLSELIDAISAITEADYSELAANAGASATKFDATRINRYILDDLKQIAQSIG